MAFLGSLRINASALTATQLRMDIISENIAHATTTRGVGGTPYRRKMVAFAANENNNFQSLFNTSLSNNYKPNGVVVSQIVEDQTPFTPVYNPEHPDADAEGYVLMPNVDIVKENIDFMAATRAFEANVTAFNTMKAMASKALELGR